MFSQQAHQVLRYLLVSEIHIIIPLYMYHVWCKLVVKQTSTGGELFLNNLKKMSHFCGHIAE